MEPRLFRHQQRIAYADCTIGNHVYYARYLDLFEAARGEFFRHLGRPLRELQKDGLAFPVTECRLRYVKPARYDDLVTIELGLELARGARMNFSYRVLDEAGELLLEAGTVHACASLDEKPRRIPVELLAKLQPFVQTESGRPSPRRLARSATRRSDQP